MLIYTHIQNIQGSNVVRTHRWENSKLALVAEVWFFQPFLSVGMWFWPFKVWLGRGKILCMWCERLEFCKKFIQVSILCCDKHGVAKSPLSYPDDEYCDTPGIMMMLHVFWGKCFSMRKLHIFHLLSLLVFHGKLLSQTNYLILWEVVKGQRLAYLGNRRSCVVW